MKLRTRTIFSLLVPFLCWGCGGFGLGGGGDMGVMPSASLMESSERKGLVSGVISMEEGFRHAFIEGMDCEPAPGEAGLPEDTQAVIEGPKGIWRSEVDGEGRFAFPPIYAGSYVLRIRCYGQVLCKIPIVVRERSAVEFSVDILGYDLGDVDDDGDCDEVLLEWTGRFRERDTEFVRTVYPDGSASTRLSDGTTEFFHAGVVRVHRPEGDIVYRLDFDNDFIPDAFDKDDDNDGVVDGRDPDAIGDKAPIASRAKEPRIAGTNASPLLVAASVAIVGAPARAASRAAIGDLLLLTVKAEPAGGCAVTTVVGSIHAGGRSTYSFTLRDDGSEEDLVDAWPGLQVSGDATAGDSVFCYILPIDRTTLQLLHECQLVFRGRNASGVATNVRVLSYSCGALISTSAPGTGSTALGRLVGAFALYESSEGDDSRHLVGRVEVERGAARGLSAFVISPTGDKKMLTVEGDGTGNRVPWATSPLPWRSGLYVLLLTNQDGAVFYAGFPVR